MLGLTNDRRRARAPVACGRFGFMRKFVVVLLAGTALGVGSAHAQNVVERLDPALDALIGPDTKVEKIYEEDQFFEGPIWHHGKEGSFLTFSDLISNKIDKWDPKTKQVTTYLVDIWKGKDKSNAIAQQRNGKDYVQVGSNGQTIDRQGRLVFVAMGSGEVVRREADGKLTVLADKY